MIAEIVTGEVDAADIVFLVAAVVAVVAVFVVRLVGRGAPSSVFDVLMAIAVGLIAWGLLLQ